MQVRGRKRKRSRDRMQVRRRKRKRSTERQITSAGTREEKREEAKTWSHARKNGLPKQEATKP